jgi:DNA-binding NarL/FixJ family response regulator
VVGGISQLRYRVGRQKSLLPPRRAAGPSYETKRRRASLSGSRLADGQVRAVPSTRMGATANPSLDGVAERQRAVALARHYREAEGISIAQIAERLGRAPATVKAYLSEPAGYAKQG